MAYLDLQTVSDKGATYYDAEGNANGRTNSERTLIPSSVNVLRQMPLENRPFLIRKFLHMRELDFEEGTTERLTLQRERLFVSSFFLFLRIPCSSLSQ